MCAVNLPARLAMTKGINQARKVSVGATTPTSFRGEAGFTPASERVEQSRHTSSSKGAPLDYFLPSAFACSLPARLDGLALGANASLACGAVRVEQSERTSRKAIINE